MRSYVIASILIIVGLISIAYKGTLPPDDWRFPYLTELSSALLVGGLLSVLFKLIQDRESENKLRRMLRIHDSVDELGLVEIVPESQGYNFTLLVEESDLLIVVMNDALRWVGNNTVSLQNRLSRKGKSTEVFIVDPDSTFVSSLAAKIGITKEDLQKKIKETWKRLEEIYNASDKKSKLTIYRLKTYPTRSMFLTETTLVETPYQVASGRANIPVYVYRKVARHDSPYGFAYHDIDAIRNESTIVKQWPEIATS